MFSSQYQPSDPEKEEIQLLLPDAPNGALTVSNFLEYEFDSEFLTPSDAFSFSIGDEKLSDDVKAALLPGVRVQLILNGTVQSTGFIDEVSVHASHSSGRIWSIRGRDALAQAVDAYADPTHQLKDGQTLADVLMTLFSPFGWDREEDFIISNEANRNYRTAAVRGHTQQSEAKGFGKRALKDWKVHQTRPYPQEGVFEFAHRLTDRFGLWIWTTADGSQLVVDIPDFKQEPRYAIIRNTGGSTNVLDGSLTFNVGQQPTAIIADSYSRNGEFGPGRFKTVFVNGAVQVDPANDAGDPPWQKYVDAGAMLLPLQSFKTANVMTVERHRVLFIVDNESTTQDMLNGFARKKLALIQQKSLNAEYTVPGHGQETPDGYVIWDVDTTVFVEDDAADFSEVLYVLGRTFVKSRSSGTTTKLKLIRLNTLPFFPLPEEKTSTGGTSTVETFDDSQGDAVFTQNIGTPTVRPQGADQLN